MQSMELKRGRRYTIGNVELAVVEVTMRGVRIHYELLPAKDVGPPPQLPLECSCAMHDIQQPGETQV